MFRPILAVVVYVYSTVCLTLPSEIPTSAYKYPLRNPMRYSYYRMNSKAEFNPLISHIAQPPAYCSSKLGPYCSKIFESQFQEYALAMKELNDEQKKAYNA